VREELEFLRDKWQRSGGELGLPRNWEWIGRPGWFGDDVWFRARPTCACCTRTIRAFAYCDWKTGKKYFSNEEQIELFALWLGTSASHSRRALTRGCWYTDAAQGR
jgi:hypothetical protein